MAKVIGFETLTVGATAVGPTAASLKAANLQVGELSTIAPSKGLSANYAFFGPVETQECRWRDDGTAPTSGVGHLIPVGSSLEYEGDLHAIKFIKTGGSDASLPVTYYRRPKTVSV